MIRLIRSTDARRRRRIARPNGFTLVELMAVITIIGILASIFLLALAKSTETSKAARSRSLVTKIHNMLMARWDAYRTIRLPINAEAKGSTGDAGLVDAANEQQRYRQNVARRRLFAIRELMRMEMPDRYSDLSADFNPTVLVLPGTGKPVRPYLWSVYQRRMRASHMASSYRGMSFEEYYNFIGREYESGECLYLILTSGIDDASVSTEHFSPNDVGDKDKDGMSEFHDSWGNPIEFLRWAPGYVSPMQPVFRYDKSDDRATQFHSTQHTDPDDSDFYVSRWQIKDIQVRDFTMSSLDKTKVVTKRVVIDQDDPFNPLRVGPIPNAANDSESSRWIPGTPCNELPEHGFLLIPLVYSCGPDYKSGINHYVAAQLITAPSKGGPNGNVYFSDPYATYQDNVSRPGMQTLFRGYRGCSTGAGFDFDNISNQQTVSE